MTNEAQSTKSKQLVQGAGRHSDFEIRILFVIRHPSFPATSFVIDFPAFLPDTR